MTAQETRDLLNNSLDENLKDVFQCIKDSARSMETEWICTFHLSNLEISRLRNLGYRVDIINNINEEEFYKITWN